MDMYDYARTILDTGEVRETFFCQTKVSMLLHIDLDLPTRTGTGIEVALRDGL